MIERAVVTVSYGSDDELSTFLTSIEDSTSTPVSIVVADNLPQGTVEPLVERYGGTYLPLPSNPGYGGAINAAVRALPASVRWVLISNPDVILSPGSLDTLIATAESDERIGSVGPLVRNSDETVYPSARSIPSLRNGVGHALFAGIWPGNPWTHRYHAAEDAVAERDAGWLSGSCLLVRRAAFEQNGGFDESFFMYFEDVDLGYRLHRSGWRNVYQPAAEVLHTGAHSTSGGSSAAMIEAHHASARRFIEKKYAHPLLWPLRATIAIGLSTRAAWATRMTRRAGR